MQALRAAALDEFDSSKRLPFSGRKAKRIHKRGTAATAEVVGMQYRLRHSGGREEEAGMVTRMRFALRVHASTPFVAGAEHVVDGIDHLRLGQVVNVHHYKGRAVLARDVGGGIVAAQPGRSVKAPPLGIDDNTLFGYVLGVFRRRKSGTPATITFTDAAFEGSVMRRKLMVTAQVQGSGFDTFSARVEQPASRPYAAHLEMVGVALPGWARPGKKRPLVVDWASAAMAHPGIGEPPANFGVQSGSPMFLGSAVAPAFGGGLDPGQATTASGGDTSFDSWATAIAHIQADQVHVAQQPQYVARFGYSGELWAQTDQHWRQRMLADPTIAASMQVIYVREMSRRNGR